MTANASEIKTREKLNTLFNQIYEDIRNDPSKCHLLQGAEEKLEMFINDVFSARHTIDTAVDSASSTATPLYITDRSPQWYQQATMYCLYVDLFNLNLQGLIDRLDYLQQLGVTLLWLLPILDSPLQDGGFDIRNYNSIRRELHKPSSLVNGEVHREQGDVVTPEVHNQQKGGDQEVKVVEEEVDTDPDGISVFRAFVKEAHGRGMSVLIDIALNHTSDQHQWFQSALQNDEKYRDFYIWSETGKEFPETRVIFEGICTSIWNRVESSGPMQGKYYLHRFLEEQPDLNYHNPDVLFAIARVFMFWQQHGVDAFRADAIPFIWKEEGTTCESLPQVHLILKFLRATMEHLRPGTMILAEACQQPREVVQYFGQEDEFGETDECQAAYHFPLIPQLFYTFATESNVPVVKTLDASVTPEIPPSCQWFLFLRCHDELTLEMVPKEDQERIYKHYCRDERWNFREHQGVSARLADLLNYNTQHIQMAHSILCTIIGTPILYYGDEFGMKNDDSYFEECLRKTKIHDTRNFNRGRVQWDHVLRALTDRNSQESQIFLDLQLKLKVRQQVLLPWLGNASVEMVSVFEDGVDEQPTENVLAYRRIPRDTDTYKETLFCVHNLSSTRTLHVRLPYKVAIYSPIDEPEVLSENAVFDLLGKQLHVTITPAEGSDERSNLMASVEMAPFDHFWLRTDEHGRLRLFNKPLWEEVNGVV